jgi:hypothetical protein
MKTKIAGIFVAAAALFAHSAPLVAHHGNASFDDKVITLKGTVTEWVWSNPHCFLKFDVKDENGNVKNWAVETQNPTSMSQLGWERTSFRAGDPVTVTLQAVKSGAPIGRVRTVTFTDGRVLQATGAAIPDPPSGK